MLDKDRGYLRMLGDRELIELGTESTNDLAVVLAERLEAVRDLIGYDDE